MKSLLCIFLFVSALLTCEAQTNRIFKNDPVASTEESFVRQHQLYSLILNTTPFENHVRVSVPGPPKTVYTYLYKPNRELPVSSNLLNRSGRSLPYHLRENRYDWMIYRGN